MKKTVFALCIVLIATAFQPAYAKGEHRNPPSFEEMDTNGDGLLSKDEVRGPLLDDFDKIDRDGDGFLSESEIPEPPERPKRDS